MSKLAKNVYNRKWKQSSTEHSKTHNYLKLILAITSIPSSCPRILHVLLIVSKNKRSWLIPVGFVTFLHPAFCSHLFFLKNSWKLNPVHIYIAVFVFVAILLYSKGDTKEDCPILSHRKPGINKNIIPMPPH